MLDKFFPLLYHESVPFLRERFFPARKGGESIRSNGI